MEDSNCKLEGMPRSVRRLPLLLAALAQLTVAQGERRTEVLSQQSFVFVTGAVVPLRVAAKRAHALQLKYKQNHIRAVRCLGRPK